MFCIIFNRQPKNLIDHTPVIHYFHFVYLEYSSVDDVEGVVEKWLPSGEPKTNVFTV